MMPARSLPFYLQARLKAALTDVATLARHKDLEDVFAYDLFNAREAVQDALDTGSSAAAEQALHDIRTLWALLRGTPEHPAPRP